MDNLSSELNKLKIDKSKRNEVGPRNKPALFIIVLILLAGALFAFVTLRNPGAAPVVQTIRPRSEASSQSAVLVATGYVVAHHKIQVGSKITGRVAWIGVEKGNRVRRDQVVVRLEDREYRAQFEQARSSYEAAQARLAELERGSRPEEIDRAKADVDRAQAQLRTDEAQYKRIEGLAKEGVAAAQLLDEAKGRYDSSRANLAALTKTYELIRQGPRKEQIDNARFEAARDKAAMDYAGTILDATEIRVPSDGTILERNVEQGEMVTTSFVGDRGAKSFVVTLADLNDIQVELDINQNDFNRIVKFTEPDEYIRPEMNARVTFLENEKTVQSPKAEESKLYVVPKRAVLDRESGKAVFVVADGKVQVKPITVAKEVGTDVFVSAGLVGNEAIIVGELLNQLKAGDRVEVKQ